MANPNAKAEDRKQEGAAEGKKPPAKLYVIDTTAKPGASRTHDILIDGVTKPFTFEYGKPSELPFAVAMKFLKHDAFKMADAEGNLIEFKRRPKQPEELQAGETLKLADDETVARLEELSTTALHTRVLEMPGGERFAQNPVRDEMLEFIIAHKAKARAVNAAKPDVGSGEFTPEPELDDDYSAAA